MGKAMKVGGLLAIGLLLGALVMFGAVRLAPVLLASGNNAESRTTQVVQSVTKKQEVVLLSLGIQGIAESTDKSKILGIDIPGSDRATFLQYNFSAKLGLDGESVRVVSTGENSYRIVIPEFVFIGHDDESFRLVAEDNGVLSWVTPEVDTAEMISGILNDEAEAKYVDANIDILKDQAKVFYTGIISSIDPDVSLTFEFADAN